MTQQTLTVTLTDGRQLGYAEYGDSAGHPVLFFHGIPGSRLQTADFHDVAKAQHCRLIGIDRPGMGLSSCNPQHTLLSWADDISSLVNHLLFLVIPAARRLLWHALMRYQNASQALQLFQE